MIKVHHIGYLVKDISGATEQIETLGYAAEGPVTYDWERDVDILFMEKDGYRIELVSPKSKDSVVAELIKKYRNSPYHICYESDDMDRDIEDLCSKGFMVFEGPAPAPALDDREVVFLMGSKTGMIELVSAG